MKRVYLNLIACCLLASCDRSPDTANKKIVEKICTNDTTLYTYLGKEGTALSEQIHPFDEFGNPIDALSFWKSLATGSYIPVRINTALQPDDYQISPILSKPDDNIHKIMKEWGERHLLFYQMKGAPLPGFSFRDLNGHLYDSTTMRGKIVVIKCWFIACPMCIEEMPDLNLLVEKYKQDKNVVFVSLALDHEPELKTFLAHTPFEYAVVPDQNEYLTGTLGISLYPTHFILDGRGRVIQAADNAEQVKHILERLVI